MGVCFLTTHFSLQYAYSIYDEQLYSQSSQLLNLSSTGIENELKKLDRLSYTIATDQQIQNLLLSIHDETPEFEKYRLRALIADKLIRYAGYEKYIFSIEVVDRLGQQATAGQTSSAAAAKQQFILDEAAEGSGGTRWIIPDTQDPHLIAAREIRNYQNLELNRLGTMTVRIKLDAIVEDVLERAELRYGEIRIASDRHVMYPLRLDHGATTYTPEEQTLGERYAIRQLNDRRYFVTQIKSDYLGWTYHSVIPFDQIFTKIILMKNLLFAGFLVSLLLVMALAIRFAKGLTQPIEDLIGRMKQVQKGNFSLADMEAAESAAPQMDEVGQLRRTFRMMVQQINELITENYAKQLTIKETQFKALQAQINPHFLYNTLESINWLAKANGQPKISQMVEALGFLLRSSVNIKETLITVEEELAIVINYITIQKVRFEERLIFEMQVPAGAQSLLIPKLTLQPLLENCIHYALETMLEPCHIRISCRTEPGRLILIVRDNGPGVDTETLDRIRRGESSTRGSGIGLKNIEERIVLAFGEAYGLKLDSAPGGGFSVSVIIPDEKRDRHV
ncbi:sensor histidine kinase [Paenibacillus xerothermodurans]|uniref:histidine kinase n=2 Tax=Paenibacillus xerothermodurans TaxID=1977292 RepID=A0A2W1N445_PAEXE|nr:sensor histidine kinase [Paenibacillus xerothermodurans]